MLTSGILKSIFDRDHYGLPIKIQVLHIFPQLGRKQKLKVSDSEYIADAYIQIKNPQAKVIQPLNLLIISSLEVRNSTQGKHIEIHQFETKNFSSKIIGSPKILTISSNEYQNPHFCIFQCNICLAIVTHSGYLIENLNFSYIQSCKVGINSEVICECESELGIKTAGLFSLFLDKVKISEFPELVLQDRKDFLKTLQVQEESIGALRQQAERLQKEYEERLQDIRNCVEKIMKSRKFMNI